MSGSHVEPLDFSLELVTPAFLGGADRNWRRDEGLRVPSLRGVLRFWYRAKEGCLDTEGGAATELFERESRLFGSTRFGQGLRLIPLERTQEQPLSRSYSTNEKYLGYGAASESWRRSAPAGARFRFRALGTAVQLAELQQCLLLLHLFGGVGGRSRRGWGSVAVELGGEKPFPPVASANDDLSEWMGNLFRRIWPEGGDRPSGRHGTLRYSGFTQATQIRAFPVAGDGVAGAMSRFAEAFRAIRKNHRRVDSLAHAPPALAFGLPYSAKVEVAGQDRRKRSYEGRLRERGKDQKVDRRASPVLFKILAGPGGGLWGVLLYLGGSFFGRPETRLVTRKQDPVRLPDDRAVRSLLDDPIWTTPSPSLP